MLRIVLGVIGGFFAWMIVWLGSEKIISAIWPEGFGVHQRAFEEALKNGGPFTADTKVLLTHIVLNPIVSMMAGFLAALISGENERAPLYVGLLLLAMGLLKAVMSWRYVPVWYHVLFTALLFPMAFMGGQLLAAIP